MKKILLIASLGLFLGAASVSATEIHTTHKAIRTEQKAGKSAQHKKAHKKAHKGVKRNTASAKTQKESSVSK